LFRALPNGGTKARLGPERSWATGVKPTFQLLAALFATGLATTTAAAKPALSPFAQTILDLHNRERARLGSSPLRWDPALEAAAVAYARQLASGGALAHASRVGRTNQRENLAMGMRGSIAPQLMQDWIAEKRNFIPGIFPDVSRTGQWSDVSHYSQMIWATTTSIGCGQATGPQWDYLVCRYSPPGNVDGKPALRSPCGQPPVSAALKVTRSLCQSRLRAPLRERF